MPGFPERILLPIVWLILSGLLSACSAPCLRSASVRDVAASVRPDRHPAPPLVREPRRPARHASNAGDGHVHRGGHLYLEALAVPAVLIEPDVDENEPNGGIEFFADLDTGAGHGLAAGLQDEGHGVGLLYLTSDHTDRRTGDAGRFHGAFVEGRLTTESRHEDLEARLSAGLGVGLAGVDFEPGAAFHDSGGTALEGRVGLGLSIARRLSLELGAGYFSWGLPGETIGKGLYASVGATLSL